MEAEKIRGAAKSLTYRGVELTYCELGAANSNVIVLGAFAFQTFMPFVELLAEKYQINVKKHGIRFETAANVFLDDNALYYSDDEHSGDEERFKIVGMVEKVLTVIYTERGKANRIISARRADKWERNDYYGQFDFV